MYHTVDTRVVWEGWSPEIWVPSWLTDRGINRGLGSLYWCLLPPYPTPLCLHRSQTPFLLCPITAITCE